ncbi:hypothetical protein ACF0H5_020974 [Mactra antiquata]
MNINGKYFIILFGLCLTIGIQCRVIHDQNLGDNSHVIIQRNTRETFEHGTGDELDHDVSNTTEQHDHVGNATHEKHPPHKMHVASLNFEHVKSPFIIAVFLITAGVAKLGFHHANFLSSKVPESCLLIILGTVVGAVLYGALPSDEENQPSLQSDLFFLYLLPPIILESAFSLHDRTFYDNVGTVMIYAVLGTILNCFLIGPTLYGVYVYGGMGDVNFTVNFIQCLVFSAIIVAVDPVAVLAIFQEIGVNNTLYFLVFGESLFNDAVTVVLYNTMKTLNLMEDITVDQVILGVVQFFVVSTGGLAIGIIFGAITAILTKYTEHCRVVEPLAVFVLAYISYLMAEMFHFSGIISIIGCGLTQAQYAFHNISKKSHTTVKYFGKMMSSTCDCVIFMFLGISLFKSDVLNADHWHIGFILWTVITCLVFRFLVVFFLTFLINRSNRLTKIYLEEQFIMAYGGLRGAVAFSLVDVLQKENLPKGHFLTTTLVVIFFTVFVQGSTIKPLVKFLRVRMENEQKLQLSEEINSHVTDHVMAGIEEISGQRGSHYLREVLEHYNQKYLKMWLQRNPITNDETIMQYFEKLALEQHFEHLAGSKMIMEKYVGDDDLGEDLELELADEDDDERSVDVSSTDEIISICVPSIHDSSEDISSELDHELLARPTQLRRRRAILPVAVSKDMEKRLNENPTAEDIRRIMLPTRRQMQFKKLDRNLKTEDSETDLLRYLQSKQLRTRRLSQALWNQPINESKEDVRSNANPNRLQLPRKSIAPVVTNNYRRRLSLAVPGDSQIQGRQRGKSAGYVLKGLDSPARRRLRLRKGAASSVCSDDRSETTNLFPLSEEDEKRNGEKEKVNFDLEYSDEKEDGHAKQSPESPKRGAKVNRRSPRFQSKHGSLRRSQTEDSPSNKRKGGSLRGTKDMSEPGNVKLLKSPSSPDRGIKFVPPKDSPSAAKRKAFAKGKSASTSQQMKSLPQMSPKSSLHKNVSYNKALSVDIMEHSDEIE